MQQFVIRAAWANHKILRAVIRAVSVEVVNFGS